MSKVKLVLVGIGGYGDLYLTLYTRYPEIYENTAEIVGIVDPFAEKAPKYSFVKERGIPVFDTLDEFYKKHTADLAVISTPIPLHKSQCVTAMEHGSNVLCEKPITPTVDDAAELAEAVRRTGKKLGVGFQWSFSKSMNRLKKDILAGKFGKAVELKSLICWKRGYEYYNSWKGDIKTSGGDYILDSVVTNATAHYLHNIFFVLGESIGTAAMPDTVSAEVYRGKEIDSFDTAVLTGRFSSGAKFWYGATHSNDKNDVTRFVYRFEKGEIHFNTFKRDDHMYAKLADGSIEDYGNPQAFEELNPKLETMIRACTDETTVIPCTLETVLPHLKVCGGLFARVGIADFPGELKTELENPRGAYINGLSDVLEECFESSALPFELGAPFAGAPVTFSPGDITTFEGVKYR